MASRFDEIDLLREPVLAPEGVVRPRTAEAPTATLATPSDPAPRWRRAAALILDLSLFVALALVLSPLLPAALRPTEPEHWLVLAGVTGFLLLLSYYYFTGSWLIWGKTVGGAIFDVRVASRYEQALDAKSVTTRWLVLIASLLTAGGGFLPALLPGGYSAADRLSRTRCLRG